MNERIRELWSQAGGHYNSGNQHTWPEYTITDPEKFAELIVLECINQCAHAPDVSEDWYQGVKWVANEIAQHFGVKNDG